MNIETPNPAKSPNIYPTIPPVKANEAYPLLAIDIVVKPSGRAFPIAIIVRPRYEDERLVNIPTNVNKSIKIPLANLTHKTEQKIPKIFIHM